MRFLLAAIILLTADSPTAIGWAIFLCLWSVYDLIDNLTTTTKETTP